MTGSVVWFTGLPASGKTTLGMAVAARLKRLGSPVCLLDGDVMRSVLSPKLGYSDEERAEFYATLARLAGQLAKQGLVVLVAATANLRAYREHARELAPRFVEVWVATPLEECRRRDHKGLYAVADDLPGHLPGVGRPYEAPLQADVQATGGDDAEAVERVLRLVLQ